MEEKESPPPSPQRGRNGARTSQHSSNGGTNGVPSLDDKLCKVKEEEGLYTSSKKESPRLCKYKTLSGRRLRILSHQVAGQAPLLRLPDGKVCKPLSQNEMRYYEELKSEKPTYVGFHPLYYGPVVILQEETEPTPAFLPLKGDDDLQDAESLQERAQIERLATFMDNSWEEKFYKNNVSENKPTHLILEDLTCTYKQPCILDLKMGCRQHAKNSSPEKVRSQILKCAKTTSATLGYRLCGLKAYQVETGEYVYRDKYYGRRLTVSNIKEIFDLFFFNGVRFRNELVSMFIQLIERLMKCLTAQQGKFTWLGSSLLLIYEGAVMEEGKAIDVKCDLKMVDFAKTYRTEELLRDENLTEFDDGYIFGLGNLLALLSQFVV